MAPTCSKPTPPATYSAASEIEGSPHVPSGTFVRPPRTHGPLPAGGASSEKWDGGPLAVTAQFITDTPTTPRRREACRLVDIAGPRDTIRNGLEVEMTDTPEVTGRDSYVIAQALYEFIRLEQSKPIAERRGSDERDAKAILHARFDDELERLVQSDEAAGRKPPDCKRRVTIGG